MKKKTSRSKRAKNRAWNLFSLYIRLRAADDDGYVECVTCGTKRHYKKMQAGHFIDGRKNAVLFDERIVYPQCYRCNVALNGNKVAYTLFMLKKHTRAEIAGFEALKNEIRRYKAEDYEDIADKYEDYICGLDMCRGKG